MTLQNQLRLMTMATIVGLMIVIIVVTVNLSKLQRNFAIYQSRQSIDKSLIEIKATALFIARADPILSDTRERLQKTDTHIQELHQLIASLSADEVELKKISMLISAWDAYAKGFYGAIKIAADSPADALQIPDALFKSTLEPMVQDLDVLVTDNSSEEIIFGKKIKADMAQVLWIVLLPLIMAGIVVTLFQLFFNRRLQKSLVDISAVVDHLHRGDLSRRLPAANNDEISQMAKTINRFIARFEGILRDVHVSADQTKNTAHGISAMTTTVTSNAKAQSDKVFKVSSAVDEMGNTIREIAGNAATAAAASNEALELVKTGSETGRNTISALSRIHETVSSSAVTISELNMSILRIGAVSNMIKEIAEQTNLLALNAAIEAARAGEQGRGFAVVASEVRKLAERTATSTADITNIVKIIQAGTIQATEAMAQASSEVSQGVRHGEKMGQVLEQIDRSVFLVTEIMQQIAMATEEQSAVGTEIAVNIDTVATITAATANDIERARNAMMELVQTSRTLHEAVGQFNLSGAAA
jgi:methyl-accepting chemotaxis protein